jgi:hypothetical protein
MVNKLIYYGAELNTAVKSFKAWAPGVNVVSYKAFLGRIYSFISCRLSVKVLQTAALEKMLNWGIYES